jgi:hypothetical protein
MKTSNLIGAVIAVAIVGGGALAVAKSSENQMVSAREAVCGNSQLKADEQADCKAQMKDAKSEVVKQQIATRFQSKADIRAATDYGSTAKSSGGGSSASAPNAPAAPKK